MAKVINWVLKILYWSMFWAGGLGWVVLVQGQGDILSRLYKERLFIFIVCLLGAVGGIFVSKLLLYIHETTLSGQSKLHFSGGGLWALIWTTIFTIATIFSSDSCSGSYSCWNLGFLGKIIILVFGIPVLGLYTAFIGMVGSGIYLEVFGVGRDLKR